MKGVESLALSSKFWTSTLTRVRIREFMQYWRPYLNKMTPFT
jgi:hypothetical protein